MADILTEVMRLYSTGGLICYWRIRGTKCCIVNYLVYVQTDKNMMHMKLIIVKLGTSLV